MEAGPSFWPWWRQKFRDNATIAGGFCLVFSFAFSYGVPVWLSVVSFTVPMAAYLSTVQWFLRRREVTPPFWAVVLSFGVGYFAVFAGALVTGIYISAWGTAMLSSRSWISPIHPELMQAMGRIVASPIIKWTVVSGFIGMLLTHFFFQINRKLGPGVLWQWISGKYHQPKPEERVVLFLDMRDSTTLAEQLGDLKFSGLVKAFISDVSRAVQECKGEVSHFIGDEVVATWKPGRGLDKGRCLQVVQVSKQNIAARSGYYMREFGLVPDFKAGMHIGQVVATEVGEAKSEIVLHGDAMNTAARIQGECNRLGEEFLVSKTLVERLESLQGWSCVEVGALELKGKEHAVPVAALRLS
ncbi:MAG: adenylate/guanylate cyclase domain-containing protein [Armatimonadetes bacterium]|nr:adenylate/guanylate cyclase domain-containing protein [Armatimonadota bacterium]